MSGTGRAGDLPELKTVAKVELTKYLGKWYEIYALPIIFEKKCAGGIAATYSLRPDGDIEVINECRTGAGKLVRVRGRAWVVDKKTNAKLKMTVIPWLKLNFLSEDCWILELGPNYEYAVVGHPDRKYCWILSRTPELPEDVLKGIISRLLAYGYDFSKFTMTAQKDFKK